MNTAAFSSPLEHRIERLLCGLAGVVSARAVAQPDGMIEEIHVLATERLHPKQVVRNVESALSAGLGLDVDRRVISVAQIRGDASADAKFGGAPGSDTARLDAGRLDCVRGLLRPLCLARVPLVWLAGRCVVCRVAAAGRVGRALLPPRAAPVC